MKAQKIVVAGANGNLGKRVVDALIERSAEVLALVRSGAPASVHDELQGRGAQVRVVDMRDADEIAGACAGAQCVVSTLAGLREVLVDVQSVLLSGAVKAGVPRFIPSDFCTDFTTLAAGENRNFDLRRAFHQVLDATPIAATSIYNGAFAEVLHYDMPLFNRKARTVSYWGSADWKVDFTTMDDTAAYTADVALDAAAPRALRIASFQVSPRELAAYTRDFAGGAYRLIELGTLEQLRLANIRDRALSPEGENVLYAGWQQSQYLQSMLSTHHLHTDNARYGNRTWTALKDVLEPEAV